MHVLVLVAGTNEPSNSDALADAFIAGIREEGLQIEVIKLRIRDLRLDHFTLERYHPQCVREDDFCMLQEHVEQAAGIVIATPIWNFSVPAHLKNIIDRLGAFALDEATRSRGQLGGKPFFLIFTGGAPKIVWKTMMRLTTMHMSEAIRYYGGTVIGTHFEEKCMVGKGTFGLVVDKRPKSLRAVSERGKDFAKVVHVHADTGVLPQGQRIRRRFFLLAQRLIEALT